jgi:hypothetical protein
MERSLMSKSRRQSQSLRYSYPRKEKILSKQERMNSNGWMWKMMMTSRLD